MRSTTPRPATFRSRAATVLAAAAGFVALAAGTLPAPRADAAVTAVVAPIAATQTPAPNPGGPSTDPNVAMISRDLALVPVDSASFRAVRSAFEATARELADTTAARANADAQLVQLAARDRELTQQIAIDTSSRKRASADLAAAHATLRAVAVTSYVNGTGNQVAPDDVEGATEELGHQTVFQIVDQGQREKENAAQHQLDAADAALNTQLQARAETRQQQQTVTTARDEAAAKETALTTQLTQGQSALEQARARANVQNGDFMTLLALDAYWRAAQQMAVIKPKCGITWWALAGIGRVEGHHGTYGGAELLGNGDTSKPIIGITLDGSNDTAVIPDTDHGQYDGDPNYDHAVGPMQFIPSTWKRWKADGNGDGNSDPGNMYDAALAAGKYLCASGPMVTDDDLTRGYYSYNHSDDYAAAVLGMADYYRDNISIPKPPPDGVVPTAATPPVPSGG